MFIPEHIYNFFTEIDYIWQTQSKNELARFGVHPTFTSCVYKLAKISKHGLGWKPNT